MSKRFRPNSATSRRLALLLACCWLWLSGPGALEHTDHLYDYSHKPVIASGNVCLACEWQAIGRSTQFTVSPPPIILPLSTAPIRRVVLSCPQTHIAFQRSRSPPSLLLSTTA